MKIWIKKKRETKFIKLAKKLGADFVEDEGIVFIGPKGCANNIAGIRLLKNGNVNIGTIKKSCCNFEHEFGGHKFFPKELDWMIEVFKKIRGVKK